MLQAQPCKIPPAGTRILLGHIPPTPAFIHASITFKGIHEPSVFAGPAHRSFQVKTKVWHPRLYEIATAQQAHSQVAYSNAAKELTHTLFG